MKTSSTEVKHKVGTRKEWLAARLELLKARRNTRGAATNWH
jgi:predicted dithiol-disulfide oxidoreductase (DUF899 family)